METLQAFTEAGTGAREFVSPVSGAAAMAGVQAEYVSPSAEGVVVVDAGAETLGTQGLYQDSGYPTGKHS